MGIGLRNVSAVSPWNYALDLSEKPKYVGGGAVPSVPFCAEAPPAVRVFVKGRKLPGWQEGPGPSSPTRSPKPPPLGPAHSTEPLEELELVPYGSTNIRISVFPTLA